MIQRNAWAEINLEAIEHNLNAIKEKMDENVQICAVVKANAYGHGAVEVAKAAVHAGATFLAVAILQEALELREAGIKTEILILGALQNEYAKIVVEEDISQTVFTKAGVKALSDAAVEVGKKAKVHIAVETGMNRIGKLPEELPEFIEYIKTLPMVEIEGVFSHFATADIRDKAFDCEQYARFTLGVEKLEKLIDHKVIRHIANSVTISAEPKYHLDMVRQGITLYGLWPSDQIERTLNLWPAMKVKAKVIFVKDVEAGESIGYSRSYKVKKKLRVATLPIGYADGLNRRLSNKGYVIIHGKKARILGKVCMDQVMVDVTEIPGVVEGDLALIFGYPELPVEKVAEWMDALIYEVICLLGTRLPRVYVREALNFKK